MPTEIPHIVHPQIDDYLYNIIPGRDSVLAEMEEYARRTDFPIVGPLVGHLLSISAASMRAERILELGSGFGYSAYWFARGALPGARIICTDSKPENAQRAKDWLTRAGLYDRIDFRVGDALEIAESCGEQFDIIFNDIHKPDYPRALSIVLPKLRSGGLFIADNVLWKGKVVAGKPDPETSAILTFNRMLYTRPGLTTSIVPLRDGISISLKH